MDNENAKKICRLLAILIGVGLLQVGQASPIGETAVGEVVGMVAFYAGVFTIILGMISLIVGMYPKD